MFESLKSVPLFHDLSEDDLAAMARDAGQVHLPAGDVLFEEGDTGDAMYVITAGAVEILKQQQRGAEVLLGVRGVGEVLGEIALLLEEPRSASVRAREDTTLLSLSRDQFEALLGSSSTALRSVFGVVLDRWRNTQAKLRHSERMAQLGTLTAGMMHELNNPASAVTHSTTQMPTLIAEVLSSRDRLIAAIDGDAAETIDDLLDARPPAGARPVGPLALSDREEQLEVWLSDRGHAAAFTAASRLAQAGYTPADLDTLVTTAGDAVIALVDHVAARCELEALVRDAEQGSRRISNIVDSMKAYSLVDQAPVQHIDVASGVQDAIQILGNTLGGIELVVEAEPGLPKITAHAAELNQVWTNLLDNAIDAIEASGRGDGRIVVRIESGDSAIVVEIEDNGVGIPEEIAERIFDPFFTTKEPGAGTGLGLDLVNGIVVDKHRGHISAASSNGSTRFRVALPTARPA